MRWLRARTRAALLSATALTVGLGACNTADLVRVPDPDVVAPPVFLDPQNLPAVHAGAVREFARAYGGTQNTDGGQILYSGLLADEFYHSGTFSTRQQIDQRDIDRTNGNNQQAFFWLQRARNHAEQAAALFAKSDQAGSDHHAEVLLLAGFTYDLFAEDYCSGVPFSTLPLEGATVYGEPETTAQILQRARDRFDAVLGMSVSADLMDAARVGKGRALLDLGQYAEAATAVQSVPTTFAYVMAYDAAVVDTWNAVWQLNNAEKRWSAAGAEGTNGLPFTTSGDPRTPAQFTGGGFDAAIPHYDQLKYDDAGVNVPLATGIEARLIEAEAALNTGDRGRFFDLHNGLRATMGLSVLIDDGQSMAALIDLHFRERAQWLWLTAHRLGDLRRLVRQYDRTADQVFPVGPTEEGEPRGTNVALPVPFQEGNNPQYDASRCNPDSA